MDRDKILPILAAITYSTIFGLAFMFTKVGLETLRPIDLLAYRFLVAALTLMVLKVLKIIKIDLKGKSIRVLLLIGILQTILYPLFQILGLSRSTASEAGMLEGLIPIFSAVLGFLVLKERLKRKQVIFIFWSILGVVFINVMKEPINLGESYLGTFLLIVATAIAALYNISSRSASKKYTPMEITYVMMWVGAIFFNVLAIFMAVFRGDIGSYFAPLFNFQSMVSILYLGLLSSVTAAFLINYSLAKLPVFQATVFNNISTVVAILAGVLLLGDKFTIWDLIGSAMIISGVWGTVYFGKQPIEVKEGLLVDRMNNL